MTSRCLRIASCFVVLLCFPYQHHYGCEASSPWIPSLATVPQIRDEMITPVQALEAAIICEALYGMNPSNMLQQTPPQYTVLSYVESNFSSHDHHHDGTDKQKETQEFDIDTGMTIASDAYWVGNSTQRLVVAFRGSFRFEDVTKNSEAQVLLGPKDHLFSSQMKFLNVTDDSALPAEVDVRVHADFNAHVFDSAYHDIIKIIDPLLKAGQYSSVSIIGHSLGGAKASLFATYYAFHHPTTAVYVETFGQPRCGNFGFKILLESIPNLNVWRLVNQHDVVPRAPFTNYHHAGHLVWKHIPQNESSITSTLDKQQAEELAVYSGFFRTVGDATLGYAGIEDISMAVCHKCVELGEQFLKYHDITTGILPWLMKAVADPTKFFPSEFEVMAGTGALSKDAPPPDIEEVS